METIETVEVQEETKTIVDPKPSMKERFCESRPVRFVRRHKAGVIAGVAATAAAGAAAIMAARGAFDAAEEVPFDTDVIADAIPIEE